MNTRKPRAKKVPEPVSAMEDHKIGRPAFQPTKEMRESVEMMVAAGIAQDDIAGCLSISDVTLRKHFADEIAYGATRINQGVVKKLVELVGKGDFNAIKFWLQARMGWSDKTTLVDDRPPQTRVVIELVGSPPPAGKTIDHAPAQREQGNSLRNAIEFVGKS